MNFLIFLTLACSALSLAARAPPMPFETAHVVVLANAIKNTTTTIHYTATAPTPTVAPNEALAMGADVNAATKPTSTRTVNVVATIRPGDPEPFITLSYHLSTSEFCADGITHINSVYTNGDWIQPFYLEDSRGLLMAHHVPGFPPAIVMGPYNWEKSAMGFGYENGEWQCDWKEDEAGLVCGQCNVGDWNEGKLDCGREANGASRQKEAECSFVLGWQSQLLAAAGPLPGGGEMGV
ncbi:hypothetical protein PtrSN002B_002009 [Pyrenophora tritici-repentis]|uniref:Atrophin-1 multi-domain protein n=2 Tax=Pyrenophora tritici-repentis TaxID=45151 RepID=A0A2W1G6W8_9PLEO|nr:uncharacterized protein PTRG_05934 [Pyrenophora tritici-repentis Pt-1C-BFP]KAA8619055.1 hypothetical protein PtrV1_08484 [Pyrenophora tritici-repentis]EDU48854.1 predicted protein [Pyrenophora tritici-repentis Pt-1C-BFP]KAF7449519.1 hypothetical protein A1F99_065680 [Pyrenophora tritici-repentis]KAF7570367.1 Atrophin-1 multi-domain protein [Pyrenophora tritici-repentis]KAG9383538.1 hypothetical protein A1F94_005449 [Pyrenophora tritici-repentis]